MAKAIDDRLEDWSKLEPDLPEEDRGLLIGNGASIALWPQFRYSSLFDMAKDTSRPDHLTGREVSLFEALETQNFEAVLSALITAGRIWGIYGKPKDDINDVRDSYKLVRKSLIRAVKEVHVPFDAVGESLKGHLRDVFAGYQRFSKHRGSLVVFGHSLTAEFDQHLTEAIRKWKRYDQRRYSFHKVPRRRVVAVSVLPADDPHAVIDLKSRLAKALSDYEVRFFDSRTHPLGQLTPSA